MVGGYGFSYGQLYENCNVVMKTCFLFTQTHFGNAPNTIACHDAIILSSKNLLSNKVINYVQNHFIANSKT